ncbi:MAG: hypothetical protein M0Q53_15290 [Prolixibacteraceae bacterium]|jgi:hypothetical protein|nr:hypothetical protein [Prolixibacteraceae bacterium]
MSRTYKFHNPGGLYFVTFALQGREVVFAERAQICKSASAGGMNLRWRFTGVANKPPLALALGLQEFGQHRWLGIADFNYTDSVKQQQPG